LRKYLLPVAILMIAVMLGSAGCGPSELKPCTVELGYVSNEFQGTEVIVANVFLTVKNPNSVPVMLDSVDYTLNGANNFLGTKTLAPRALIPANGSVNLSNDTLIDYSGTIVTPLVLNKALDSGTAAVMALVPWKLLGGKTPPLWATAVGTALAKAPSADNITASLTDSDTTKVAANISTFAAIKGGFDKTAGAVGATWAKAVDAPCTYNVKGTATISYGTLIKASTFDLKYERK
jgi:hypothetical protein